MRKILILLTFAFSIFFALSVQTQADEVYVYPFDSIRITSAFKFEIIIEEEPLEASILYGQVAVDEIVTIYVGNLEFIFEGLPTSGSNAIMIVTNEAGVDLAAWLVNSGGSDLETYSSASFASWITIDPDVGVVKDFSGNNIEIGYLYTFLTSTYTFIDNLDQSYVMIADSLEVESDLDILISAYVEEVAE